MPIPSVLSLSLKIFGCVAYVHVLKNHRSKIEPCAIKCVSLRLGVHQKGYRCYDPVSRKWYVTMDVTFLESESYFQTTKYPSQGEHEGERVIWYQPENIDIQLDTIQQPNSTQSQRENSESVFIPYQVNENSIGPILTQEQPTLMLDPALTNENSISPGQGNKQPILADPSEVSQVRKVFYRNKKRQVFRSVPCNEYSEVDTI
jgi:hypothetical protein